MRWFVDGGERFVKREDALGNAKPRLQLVEIEWFGDEIVGPGFHAFQVILLTNQSGDENDVRVPRLFSRTDAAAKLETVEIRHQHIRDDQTELSFPVSFPSM